MTWFKKKQEQDETPEEKDAKNRQPYSKATDPAMADLLQRARAKMKPATNETPQP